MKTPPIGGSASTPLESQVCPRQELSKKHAAAWIRVLLRLQPEMPMTRLAEELGLSDRLLGKALGLLIREGKARIRDAPGGLRVVWVEPDGKAERVLEQEGR